MKTINTHGCYKVVQERLTDRSHVYNVVFPSNDGGQVVLACIDRSHAEEIASMLNTGVVDVALRDLA